jgi:glutamate synthase (NADPH) small chain
MGKLGGFLQIERRGIPHRDPRERAHDYREFQLHRPVEELRGQGARCMDCGVPTTAARWGT